MGLCGHKSQQLKTLETLQDNCDKLLRLDNKKTTYTLCRFTVASSRSAVVTLPKVDVLAKRKQLKWQENQDGIEAAR